MASSARRRYGKVAQGLHWLVFLLVAALFAIGWYMDDLPLGPEKLRVFNLHKSIGVTVLALMLLRLVWRQISPPPALPESLSGGERAAARIGHLVLYLLLLAQPMIGIVHSWSANFPIVVFDTITLPNLTGPDEALKETLAAAHWWTAWAILLLVAGHVAAALRHHFLLGDDVLRRMLPGARR